jgi:hypothetical protein
MATILTIILGTTGRGTIIAGNAETRGVRTMIIEEDVTIKEVAATAEVAVDAAEEVTITTIVSITMIFVLCMVGTNGASAF